MRQRTTTRALRLLLAGALGLGLAGCGGSGAFIEERGGQEQPVEWLTAETGLVLDVLAGDLLEIQNGERFQLADVDLPARGQPGAEAAREYVARRVLRTRVRVRRLGTGRYGHTVGLAWAQPLPEAERKPNEPLVMTLGEELVARGLGRPRDVGRYVWGTSDGLAAAETPEEFRLTRDSWWDRHRPLGMVYRRPIGGPLGGYAMPRSDPTDGSLNQPTPDLLPHDDPTRWP